MNPPIAIARKHTANLTIMSNKFTKAATILKNYLEKITSAKFTINQTNSPRPYFSFNKKDHGINGFSYYMHDGDICFEAIDDEAAVYAVYDFIERVLGCRFYTSDCEYIKTDINLNVCFDEYKYTPPIRYRELYYRDYMNVEFASKRKMHPAAGQRELTAEEKADQAQTDNDHQGWGFWCHSFETLLDPKVYFKEHPEYFALRNGERVGEKAEPCLSNPDVLKIMIENLKKHIAQNPTASYWSVSQNDNDAYCQCDKCRELDEKEGSPMGSILTFVNKLAEHFPEKTISTLAYWYSRKAPKTVRPAKNVHIMLCNIEANRGRPIETDKRSLDSKEELLAWKKICNNVFLWDYCIQFRNLVSPFPNLDVLAPNMRFFVENSVTALFSQANREYGGEFSELRGYVLSRLMWEPYLDTNDLIAEFCDGYYRSASPFIQEYIHRLHDENKAGDLSIFGSPQDGADSYLSKANTNAYLKLFDKAMTAVAYDAEAQLRVRVAKMPLLYALISLKRGTEAELLQCITEFASTVRQTGLEMVEEWKISADMFIADSLAALKASDKK